MSKIIGMITYYWEDRMIGVDVRDDGTVILPDGQTTIVPEQFFKNVKNSYIEAVKNAEPFVSAYHYNLENQIEGVPPSSAQPNAAEEEFSLRGNEDFNEYGSEQERIIEEANELVRARKEQRMEKNKIKREIPKVLYIIPAITTLMVIVFFVGTVWYMNRSMDLMEQALESKGTGSSIDAGMVDSEKVLENLGETIDLSGVRTIKIKAILEREGEEPVEVLLTEMRYQDDAEE